MVSEQPERWVGQVLSSTYRLERLLVSGGMAAVFAARHLRTEGACAVKVLHAHSKKNAELYERFRDEARISCTLRHPNIVQVMDLAETEDGTPYLVMELLEGEDLQERLDRERRLPLPQTLELARQVGSALHAAHGRDVVHRDLKPQNIFLCRGEIDGQVRETIKLLDFGLSKIRRPAEKATRDLLVLGTPRYLAPEGALGQNSQLDGRADQFSLAVILYRALTGRLPFDSPDVSEVLRQVVYEEAPPLREIAPELPEHVRHAIERAMRKDKDQRFPTMQDFVDALLGAGERPTALRALSPLRPSSPGEAPEPPRDAAPPSEALTGIVPVAAELIGAAAPHAPGKGFSEAPTFIAPAPLVLFSPPAPAPAPEEPRPPAPPPLTRIRESMGGALSSPARLRPGRTLLFFAAGAALAALLLSVRLPGPPPPPAPPVPSPPQVEDQERLRQTQARERERVAEAHLAQAQAALAEGACAAFFARLREALRAVPGHPAARALRWRPCPADEAGAPSPKALLRYPPLRAGPETALEEPPQSAEELLIQARTAHDQGRYGRAIARAHLAIGQGPLTDRAAYRVLGAAACGRGELPLMLRAWERLDPASREFLAQECQLTLRGP